MDQKFDRGLGVAVGVLAALLVLNAWLCVRNTRELNDRAGWESHTLEVEEALADLRATLTDAETNVRAFLVTGDGSFLAPYRAADDQVERVAELTRDNPAQQERVPRLRQLTRARVDELARAATVREGKGFEAARRAAIDGEGRRTMDAFRALVGEMVQEEKGLLRDRQARTGRAYQTAVGSGLLAAACGLVAVGVVVGLGWRSMAARQRAAALLRQERERLRVSLASIGDAVIATDPQGRVSFLNPTARSLTGWGEEDARGQPLERVFRIINEQTRQAVETPVARVLREGVVVGLANHTVLVARDGTERPVEDSAAPIRDDGGEVVGVILVFRDVTERRRLERDLERRRREETARLHFQALFEASPGLFLVLRPDRTIVAASDAYLAATMTRREDIVGRNLFDVFPDNPDDPAATGVRNLRASLDRVLQGRAADTMAVQKYDIRRPADQGGGFEERYWSPVNSPVPGPGGEVEYVIHRVEDVTAFVRRQQAATALAPGADESRARTERMEAEIYLRGQQLQQLNEQLRAANEALAAEVAERRRREEALRQSEERFRLLVEGTTDHALFMLDPQGHVASWNPGAERIKGYVAEEIVGQHFSRFYPREATDRGWPAEGLRRAEAEGRFEDEGWRVRKDGSTFWANVVLTALRDETGRLRGFSKVTRDLTERRRKEEELRQLHRDLERRVEERTAALAASNEALREADRRKDQFVMMLAHELRNPLAPLLNSLELLQAAGADPNVVEQARRIMSRQVGHMARIIEDLVDVSRLLRGRVELRPERLDLGRFVRTALEDQRPALDRAGLSLDAELPELPVWVHADPTRLRQVLENLLQNAAKFTDRGGRVTVRVQADAGRQAAVLTVRDTGVGIEPALLPHLFDAFTQADRSLDRSKGGLGLGLSLVKGLVELHGGTVRAGSGGPGRGSEFVVCLPLQPEPAAVTAMPAPPERPPRSLRVLVVEDNHDAAESLRMLLELYGYEVAVAHTGPEGVEAARQWRPDVVLCDIGLPELDGYGVVRELRRDPATAGARVIAVTGYGNDEDRLRSREAGFDAHLTKPADPVALQVLLARPGSPA
jgi:PAS domain S-box-containing protein